MANPGESEPTSSTARTRLRVVGAEAPVAPQAAAPAAGPRSRRPRSFWIACLLALAGLGLWLGLGSALARVRALEAENATLTSDLARTRDALEAHRARLGEVRSRVGELRDRIGSLDALLATDPAAPHAPAPAPDAR